MRRDYVIVCNEHSGYISGVLLSSGENLRKMMKKRDHTVAILPTWINARNTR